MFLPRERSVFPCCLPHRVLLQLLRGAAGADKRALHVHAVETVAKFRRWTIRRVQEEQKTCDPPGGGRRGCLRFTMVSYTGEFLLWQC